MSTSLAIVAFVSSVSSVRKQIMNAAAISFALSLADILAILAVSISVSMPA